MYTPEEKFPALKITVYSPADLLSFTNSATFSPSELKIDRLTNSEFAILYRICVEGLNGFG